MSFLEWNHTQNIDENVEAFSLRSAFTWYNMCSVRLCVSGKTKVHETHLESVVLRPCIQGEDPLRSGQTGIPDQLADPVVAIVVAQVPSCRLR